DTLSRISHRKYHTGFFLGKSGEQTYDVSSYVRDYDLVGSVLEYDAETKIATVLQKNRVFEGDVVDVLRPHTPNFDVKLNEMFDVEKDVKTTVANRAHMIFKVKVETPLKEKDMLMKCKKVLEL
ncbi:MAG: U32 family peptidase C-terminal domain-containing protein, partial [Clostridium sp.]